MGKQLSYRTIARVAGAMCAYWMGSGFATGQEVLQFFATNGLKGIMAVTIFFVITAISTYFICGAGQKEQFENPFDIFEHYCGKWLGKIYNWFSVIVMYGALIVILAGGGESLHQFYGMETHTGTIIIGLLALGTALLGVKKLIHIAGMIGPVEIVFILILGGVGLVSLSDNPQDFLENSDLITRAGFESASPHWALSGALYAFLVTMSITPFLVSCGMTMNTQKEARIAALTGTVAFVLSILMLASAELIYFELFVGKQVPTLAMAYHMSNYFGIAFTMIIAIASYSAVSSNLLMVTRRFAVDKTKTFNVTATVLILVAIILSGTIPFETLVNTLFPILAYSAILFIVLMIYKEFKQRIVWKGRKY